MQQTRVIKDSALFSVLAPNAVLVESLGMQHWLNMALASKQGIAMNMQYPMPTRFMWQIARKILGSELIPEQSSYKREVLTWRIYSLLDSAEVLDDKDNQPIREYFARLEHNSESKFQSQVAQLNTSQINAAKRLQFCRSVADVYEQYMLYRPDWLSVWESDGLVASEHSDISANDERWQANLWRRLVAQHPYHPASLHTKTLEALRNPSQQQRESLPEHVYVFALNTMAPQLVTFMGALAEHCEVHIFHLNPCINYWGEVRSQKQVLREKAKALTSTTQQNSQQFENWLSEDSSNPLLANLGHQGRDLFNLLQQQNSFEVSAFEAPISEEPDALEVSNNSLLKQVKQAIFDGQSRPSTSFEQSSNDPSVVVVKAHSALRELQALHDYLSEQMNSDKALQPRDVLIMCPAIENYAAFIPTVFSTRYSSSADNRIPCSVADRTPLDSMPDVSAFLTLLDIPQSRFEVSSIIDYLRLPSVQQRFGIEEQELDLIIYWLSSANVHWGLNEAHKKQFVETQANADINTWEWGLKRLLIGIAQVDQPVLQEGLLTLPHAEGKQAEVLGKLCALLEQLQWHLAQLKQHRNVLQWQEYLNTVRQRFFGENQDNQRAIAIIDRGIGELKTHCEMADFDGSISIFVLREALDHMFTAPDAINQFMTGHVTFCSMLPMRSIPFKIIAMLGLNDGEFPRTSTPFSIDLMQATSRRLGDRSRRGDDRYLFLESVISARQILYLSYQSRSVKDNSERQPSLVLREFCDYLQHTYGDPNQPDKPAYREYELPLHAFHSSHFQSINDAVIPSYDSGWLRLAKSIVSPQDESKAHANYKVIADVPNHITTQELIKALQDPLKYFAHHSLGLYLDTHDPELLDSEPFAIDGLHRFKLLSELFDTEQDTSSQSVQQRFDSVLTLFEADGSIPMDAVSSALIASWHPVLEELHSYIGGYNTETLSLTAQCSIATVEATVQLVQSPSDDTTDRVLLDVRTARMHSQHHLHIRLKQWVASIALSKAVKAVVYALEPVNGELKVNIYEYAPIEIEVAQQSLDALLESYRKLLLTPCLLHCELGDIVCKHLADSNDTKIDTKLALAWQNAFNADFGAVSSINNDYLCWFFDTVPAIEDVHVTALLACYRNVFSGFQKLRKKPQKKDEKG